MKGSSWTEADTALALHVWDNYRSRHEVEHLIGQTVGIEPNGGRLWFGSNASDVARKRDADGIEASLYFLRVGRDYYLRKM